MSEVQSLPDQIERLSHALSAAELAELLAVSRVTGFKQAKAGRIPCFRIGTCVRFDPEGCGDLVAHDVMNLNKVNSKTGSDEMAKRPLNPHTI